MSNLQHTTTHTTYTETKRQTFRSTMLSGKDIERKLSTQSYNEPYKYNTNPFAREFNSIHFIEDPNKSLSNSNLVQSKLPSSFKRTENDSLLKGRSAAPYVPSNSTPRNTNFTTPGTTFLSTTTHNTPVSRTTGTVPISKLKNNENIRQKAANPSAQTIGEKLKIVVKKGKFIPSNMNVPMYKTNGRNRGKVLIINNIMFEKKDQYRKGAEVDESNLKKLFDRMGFKVKAHQNLKAAQMKDTLQKYSKNSDLKSIDISIIVMMSHGNGQVDGSTYIMGTDHQPLGISDIVDIFDNVHCPLLVNKPKIFIFQCCRGGNSQIIENDASPFVTGNIPIKKLSDILIAYSTIPGYVSNRNPEFGTWYISSICKVFMEHAWNTHVEDLLKLVEEELTKKSQYVGQTSNYDNRGFKICYLNPK